jgi:hypothetical protein
MDRNPNEDVMQGGILKKITYPSKGYTRFFYEAHRADNKIYGGLRIKEIQNYDANDVLVEKKWYKYGVNESGQGRPASYIMPPDTSNPNFAEDFCERSLVVTDGEDSVKAAYIEKETYIRTYYPFPKMSYFTSGSSVVYPEVTEYSGTGTTPNGKTVYKYTDFPEEKRPTNRGYSVRQLYKSYPWKNGQLLSKTVYDNTGKIVYSLNNNYSYLADSAYLNLSVRQYADIISTYPLGNPNGPANLIKNSLGDVDFNPFVPFIDAVGGTLFDYYNYYITTGIPIITSSSEYMDGLTKTTTYSNYNSIGLPGEMQILDSKGAGYTTKYKYHYTTISETQRYKASTILSQTINEYQDWGNGMIEPGIIKFQPTTISPLESRIVYHNRDKYGNAQFISKDGTENIVYIWSYNGQYPIAEIKNATYDNVLNAIGGQWEIDHIADEAEPSTDDFDLINGLRSNSALKSAIISTYTYLPGVGMTSSSDSRGNMIYYRYDSFGRLVIVFDKNKQVIKHYCYNYAGQQTENCEVTSFKNVAASKTYKRNNCTAGYEGADVLYSVPAGKYISYVSQKDADQQAQNDIESNGQEYANQQGACLAKINYTFNIKNYISVNAPGANNNTNFNITIVGGDAAGVHMVQGNGGTTTVQAGTFPNNNATIIINFYPYSGSPAAHYVTMSGPFGTKTASTESNNTATFSGLNLTTLGTINVSFN